jgi:hypothetical protein
MDHREYTLNSRMAAYNRQKVDRYFQSKNFSDWSVLPTMQHWRGTFWSEKSGILSNSVNWSWQLGELTMTIPKHLPLVETPSLVAATIYSGGVYGTREFRDINLSYDPPLASPKPDAKVDCLRPGAIFYGTMTSFSEKVGKFISRTSNVNIMFVVEKCEKNTVQGVFKSNMEFKGFSGNGTFRLECMADEGL